jgi:hypothetical protein
VLELDQDMTRLLRRIALLIPILCGSQIVAAQSAPRDVKDFGVIEGQVVDIVGAPVEGVTVRVQYERPGSFLVPTSKTAVDGRFRILSVLPGWVHLTTSKREEGYPDTLWSISVDPDDYQPLDVFVSAGETTRGVLVELGPRCGTLTGIIVDSSTGKPLVTARLELFRDDTPREPLTTGPEEDGRFIFALRNSAYTLKVSAPGFKAWRSDEDADQIPDRHIRLSQGDVLRLTIALDPEPENRTMSAPAAAGG